jgi:cysteine desulfurase
MKQINLDAAAGRQNPSSLHGEGVQSARRLAAARELVSQVLACRPDEIIFTSGGTESNNLAIFGLSPKHLVITKLEHASVLEPAKKFKHTLVSVNSDGFLDLEQFKKSLKKNTELVSVIYAHNEIGVIQPIRGLAKIIRQFRQQNKTRTPYLHIDACQAPRYLPLDVQKLGVDLLTLNGGKLGVPGVGLLYVRRGVPLQPLILGGGQENGRRAGTENMVGIEAFAQELARASKNSEKVCKQVSKLQQYFLDKLLKLPGAMPNGARDNRLPNNINISFAGLDGEQIVLELDARGVLVSTGAACNVPDRDASYVIMALGKSREEALSAVRFTLSPETKKSELDYVLKSLSEILPKLNSVKNLNKII